MRTLVYLLLLPLFTQAQNEPGFNAALIEPNFLENADAVIRRQEMTFTVSGAGEAELHEKRVVTLLNDKSGYDQLVLYYDSFNKIGKISGSIYDAEGRLVRSVEKNEINDRSAISDFSIYEDSRVKYVDVNYDRYPYTIAFEYEIKYRYLRGYPHWDIQAFNTAVEQASYTVEMPSAMKLYHKSLNISLSPTETVNDKKRIYQWQAQNLPAIIREPYAPSAYELLPVVMVSPDVFKADNYTGSMASWQAFGQFQYELAKGRDALSKTLKTKVSELTANVPTEAEKIAVLYRFMQENFRYVSVQLGIGGWQPFDAQYVEKNKYGDCKALSNFMKALLKEAGITAYPALVKAGDNFLDLPDDFATSAFNHMILYVPSQDTWLECTSNSYPPNYLGSGTDDRKVLLITEQGGKLARTPAMLPAFNTTTNRAYIALKSDGEATISVNSTLRGALHEWYRYASDELTPEELQKEMQKRNPLPQAYFTKLNVRPRKESPVANMDYELRVPQYGSKTGKRFFLPVNPVNSLRDVPPVDDRRLHPVVLPDGYVEQDTIFFHIPEGFEVESIPSENTAIETEFGKYMAQIIRQDRKLVFIRHLEMNPVRLPAERYAEWRNFCRDVAKADGMKVVLVHKT